MDLLIAERLPEETAIDRTSPWTVERDDEFTTLLQALEPYDDDVPLAEWERQPWEQPWERPAGWWLEMRLAALRALFTEEAE
jgi:hypothetical protein